MDKKISILYITTSLRVGGAERLLADICAHLDESRYAVAGVFAIVDGGPIEEALRSRGVPVRVFHKKSKLGLGTIAALYREMRKIKPDIVHTHLFGGDTWGRIAALLARVPIIISTEHNINHDEGFLKRLVKKLLSFGTDRIAAVSEAVRAFSVQSDHINPNRFTVIHNGIDLARYPFRGVRLAGGSSAVNAGVVARLVPQKGHRYLIEALPAIRDDCPGFTVTFYGEGPLAAALAEQAKMLGVADRVRFAGGGHDIPGALRDMDLFILPSVWEGFGIAILEALAVGVPVIASDVDGLREIISDNENGLLCAPRNPDAIAEAVRYAINHPEKQQQWITKGREEVEAMFRIEEMVRKYEALYDELVKNNK